MKRWITQVKRVLQAILRDLFREEDQSQQDRIGEILDAMQSTLELLRDDLAEAVAREKRIERAWRQKLSEVAELKEAVDAALQADQDDEARMQLDRERHAQAVADEMRELHQHHTEVTSELRKHIRDFQERLELARRQLAQLDDLDRSTELLEQLNHMQHEGQRRVARIRLQLDVREEEIALREDQIAARSEVARIRDRRS